MFNLPGFRSRNSSSGEASVYRPLMEGSYDFDEICPLPISREDACLMQSKIGGGGSRTSFGSISSGFASNKQNSTSSNGDVAPQTSTQTTSSRASVPTASPAQGPTQTRTMQTQQSQAYTAFGSGRRNSAPTMTTTLRRTYQGEKFGIMLTRVGESVIVILVRESSMAARAGVKFGDQILAVDGVPVTADERARDVAARIVARDECHLTIRKQPHVQEHTLMFSPGSSQKRRPGLKLKGGIVTAVERGSAAEVAYMRPDVVVVAVNNESCVGCTDKEIKKRLMTGPPLTTVHTISRATFETYVRGVRDVNVLKTGQ